jgi:hypothetical protein
MSPSLCSACGAAFACGNESGAAHCWCSELPPLMPMNPEHPCLCPRCLHLELRRRIAAFVSTVTPNNAAEAAARARRFGGDGEPVEGIDYEMEHGLLVFSAWYLLKRGTCCEAGCRHCPYGFRS